ncbi:hypothetical protein J2Z21_009351 [Streptomyces griseochromogenes]|uniref:Uncharacterized protein n=1 Tax=Streptomyces griseochromogenes TaxID=68214 RepID=A0A1B1B4C3_9ACTN|nr:hypothetical protein [Streptomyces griseochromogenes]ANP53666.1 hypothetical protein AVL59_32645 [Streptomyces griseochromogenes]MBP2056333.1 hypothetical protein [Streptomyces griseochromogenes]
MASVQLELPIAAIRQPDHPAGKLSIQERFEAFHQLNPWILRHLEALTADCVERGLTRIGIGMLFEVLRWQYGIATQGEPWKLNNDFRSRYVRLLLELHPEWSSLFETRKIHTV